MALRSFNHNDLILVSDALDIAEDATGNFFKFSLGQWKRHRYDVKTLSSLKKEEIKYNVFASLNKGSRAIGEFDSKTRTRDFYFICLQDHRILNALSRDKEFGLLALMVYIFNNLIPSVFTSVVTVLSNSLGKIVSPGITAFKSNGGLSVSMSVR